MEPHKIIDNDDFQDGFCRWWFPHSVKKSRSLFYLFGPCESPEWGPFGIRSSLDGRNLGRDLLVHNSQQQASHGLTCVDHWQRSQDVHNMCVHMYIHIYIYICMYIYIYIYLCVCVDRTKVISHIQYYMLGRSIDGWIGGSMDRRLDGSIDIYLWPVAGSSQVGTRGHKCTNHKDLGSKDYSADMRIWMGIHVWIRFFMWGICIYIYTHTYIIIHIHEWGCVRVEMYMGWEHNVFVVWLFLFTLLHLVFSVVMIQGGMKNDEKRKICKNPEAVGRK